MFSGGHRDVVMLNGFTLMPGSDNDEQQQEEWRRFVCVH